jgi:predicted Zn finger-like uncharacterized protein
MMFASCPYCASTFRITRAQLEARTGRVRCGRCYWVFDARATLQAAIPVNDPATRGEQLQVPAPATWNGDVEPAAKGTLDTAASEITPGPAAGTEAQPVLQIISGEKDADRLAAYPLSKAMASRVASETLARFGFRARTTRRVFWWWLLSFLLVLALISQVLFYFRGAVALLVPESKPYILELCAEAGCEVPLPRRAELMSIETSSLQADPGNQGVMVLSATLRNRAAFPQAYPALELTLTNDRDQPLVRRVLQPADYVSSGIEDGFGASSELPIRLQLDAAAIKATSYRLYLFYP